MKTCINCGQLKNDDEFKKNGKSKDGLRNKCIACEQKIKEDKKSKRKYRKTYKLINPVHPIPVKLTTIDGFGGYYQFDMDKLKEHLSFAKQHGMKNHMVNRKFKCWQVKSTDEIGMRVFCDYIGMSRKAIIKFEKPESGYGHNHNTVYVVNLFHKDILKVVTNVNNTKNFIG